MTKMLVRLAKIWSLTFVFVITAIVANGATESAKKTNSPQQLEQLVAPIALHPDDLLGQILMASTYPLEVIQAARWVKSNPKIKGKALQNAMQKKSWDASVKGLTAVPQVLQMMNDKLEWTQKLGDAVLAQKADVLAAVQRLRAKAKKKGALKTTSRQIVKTETKQSTTYIIIERTNPNVVYVPVYNPTVVYGVWPYPAYPPYYWYPPGYVASRAIWFGAGVAVGAAIWGNTNWRRGEVNINVNRYNNFNRSNIGKGQWQHNPKHRGAVPYRNPNVAKRYGRTPRSANRRQAYRGRPSVGRGASRGPGSARSNQTQRRNPTTSGMNRKRAYDGVGRGNQTRRHSNRGNRSFSASQRSFGGGRRGGGARRGSFGGGRRGGGGRGRRR